jgi:uncharacterized protein YndB with AHSA1/START domain
MGDGHVRVMINAPPEIMFGLYTDPAWVREWLSGVRDVRTAGPADQPGSWAVITYRWPFKMAAEVLQVEPPSLHVQRLKELPAGTSRSSRRWPRSKLDSAGSDAREVA